MSEDQKPPVLLDRTYLVNACIAAINARTYLEVGVSKGATFFSVKCEKKIAVDPKFRFDVAKAREQHADSAFHEVTSDAFFASEEFRGARFDVIFLDGLHTAEQTLRDFANAIEFLSPNGVIIIDDVVPDSYYASLRDQGEAGRVKERLGVKGSSWMGDVFKVVPFIQTFFQQYNYALPDEIRKCLVVWKEARPEEDVVHRRIEEAGNFPFENTVLEPSFYKTRPLAEILDRVGENPSK